VPNGEPPDDQAGQRDKPGGFELGTDGPSVILVGIDDTVTSLRAAAYAAGLARRQHARVVVVYVAPLGSVVAASSVGATVLAAEAAAHDELAGSLRDRADRMAAELGIPVTFVAAHGDPYHEIKRVAEETRADAIVVGASAQAGHRLIGSLAVRLVRAGRWPVTVVP
jgi:nucleotide-binding universal stress UspA family protein